MENNNHSALLNPDIKDLEESKLLFEKAKQFSKK